MGSDFWLQVDKAMRKAKPLPVVCSSCDSPRGVVASCDYDVELGFDNIYVCNCCSDCRRACYENV